MYTTLLALLAPVAAPVQDADDALRPLTLAETNRGSGVRGVSFAPRMPRFRWGPAGRLVQIIEPGEDARWIDARTGEAAEGWQDREAQTDDSEVKARVVELEERLAGSTDRDPKECAAIAEALGRRFEQASDDGTARMVYHEGELWFHRDGSDPRVLAHGADGEIVYDRLSPDGRALTFVRDGDFMLVDTATGEVTEVTTNGGPDQFNGILDWVYQEEIYGRGNFLGHAWSPSSEHALFLSLDESPVHEFTVVDHIEDDHFRVEPEVTNYPKVGDPNPIPAVGIAKVPGGETTWVDLSRYDGQEILVVRFGWTPAGDRAIVMIQDRIQTWADVLLVDPDTGANEVLIREESKAWTERPDAPRWMEDGSFLWMSHRAGPMHVYRYAADGTLMNAVTSGPWNVTGITHVEEPRPGEHPDGASVGRIWFRSTKDGDIDVNLYRVDMDGRNLVRLTPDRGTHSVSWNDDRTMFIDRVSSLTNPGTARVVDADGNVLTTLVERADVPAARVTPMGEWELHRVQTRDGMTLDAALLKPADFDPGKSYAVWVSTYSGPAAPSVRNRWSSSSFNHFLAQNGILVLQANVRSSTNRGPAATAALYKRVGLDAVEDMSDVVDWLCQHPWADAERVGITGYSFGGTMTANCLMRTDKFALGIAGGGVYDWRMYDTIYTERYMQTPETNLEGYEATSCLKQAAGLDGFLHMHHGIMDDNVHVQNMHQMAYALMKAGRTNWSMMAYPQTRHGIRDRALSWHARRVEWGLIQEHLLR